MRLQTPTSQRRRTWTSRRPSLGSGATRCAWHGRMRLLLDSDAGTLTVKRTVVSSGLTGDLCWALCQRGADSTRPVDVVRIKEVDPAEF